MTVQYDLEGQQRVYEKWAPIYDAVYNRFLTDAHSKTSTAAAACGRDILEVGVGTGLMLRYYPSDRNVIGVDLSVHMLEKAVEKVRDLGLGHVKLLASMDACRLGFRDESFDAVAVPFVITLVPNPESALDEMRRVLRPGGEIVVTSKLGVDKGLQAWAEERLAPLMGRIGWSSHFKVSRLEQWAARHPDMQVVEVAPVFPAGFFKLVRIRKR
ncbi:class I SAM-dependent methyltransferase [Flaviflagellibacter deserti]|uniref:Class I SAM-dependent methyltransferase n=1 Tax=Flaviflagellibacter deserti TaxID=2267266 RepID=A0ABV9YXI4_9HYPH